MASNHEQSESEEECIGYIEHRRFTDITKWILWLIFEKKPTFDDLRGNDFLNELWLVLLQHHYVQVPADVEKSIRILFAHVIDISHEEFEKALTTRPAKPNTKIMATTPKDPRPSDKSIKEAWESVKIILNEGGPKTIHKLADTVNVTRTRQSTLSSTSNRLSTSSVSDGPLTSANSSSSNCPSISDHPSTPEKLYKYFSWQRVPPLKHLTPSKRRREEHETRSEWLPEVLQMTLGDFKDVKVIGSSLGAIEEYKSYTISEFLQLPLFARAKAVADPAEALSAYKATNEKMKGDAWFRKLERMYKKAKTEGTRYIEVALPEVSDNEIDTIDMKSSRNNSGDSIGVSGDNNMEDDFENDFSPGHNGRAIPPTMPTCIIYHSSPIKPTTK